MTTLNQKKFKYTVPLTQVTEYVEMHPGVQEYLNQFLESKNTYYEKSVGLVRFFNWLKIIKGIEHHSHRVS